jgi:hypothetical protein
VADVVDIPLEDGQRPGREVTVELDDNGLPPAEVNVAGQHFELEPVAGSGPPWVYRRATASR